MFIEAQLRLRRNDTAIYQDLVNQVGFTGRYNSVKRFAGRLVQREPEQFDRLEFGLGDEAQVDYGEGALTRMPSSDRYPRHARHPHPAGTGHPGILPRHIRADPAGRTGPAPRAACLELHTHKLVAEGITR